MITRELFNIIIIIFIIINISLAFILYSILNESRIYIYCRHKRYSFINGLRRAQNGTKRFFKRLRVIWPMHLLFLITLVLILFLFKIHVISNLEQYLLSLANLIIIIYFIDFLNSEQSRRDSANKRYLVDVEIYQVVSQLTQVFDLLLSRDSKSDDEVYSYYQISYQMTEDEIYQIINMQGFWEKEEKYFINVYETQITTPKIFLKNNISTLLSEVGLFLAKYSNLILYDDFRLIHQLEYQLKRLDDVLKYDVNFVEDNISHLLIELIQLNKECEIILNKWH